MAEEDIKIKDAPLVESVSGIEKMPASDGSGLPKAVSINQILSKADVAIAAAVKVETDRAKEAEQANAESISNEVTRATKAESANATAISNEVARATGKENDIATSVMNEELRAVAAEQANAKAINEEAARAKSAEQANATSISDEVSRAKEAEQANATAIANEVERSTQADAELQIKDEVRGIEIRELADDSFDKYNLEHLPLLCGQPAILFGDGAPQASVVPDNWIGLFDGGFEWVGKPVCIGQQYIDTSVTSGGRYIGVRNGVWDMKWINS